MLGVHRRRVVIVDDHELLRDGLRMLIEREQDLGVCGEAVDEAGAKDIIGQSSPDIVIADLSLQSGNGLDLITWIKKHHPHAKTIVSTMHDEKVYGERVLRAGASGFVNKQDPARTILTAIRQVLAGKLYFSDVLVRRAMQGATANGPLERSPVDFLSNRELEVFRMIGQGLKTGEIAQKLYLSTSTVETYRERLKTKFHLHTSGELNHLATQWVLENP
jgi:DNA-binding NarL/FixJ family response regulator